jgi:hypothetical protein
MYFPPMFQHLLNFGYQRRGIEVLGFFIAYLLGTIMAGAVAGSIVASVFGGDAARINWKIDTITASIVMLLVTFFIIKQKHLGPNIIFMLLPLGTAILSQFLTPAIALIIPSFLSSLPPKIPYTPPPTSGNMGANENIVKAQQNEPPPPPPPTPAAPQSN